jgi:small-conductance mechanosensitive channel
MPNSFSLPLFSAFEFLVFIFLIYILLRVAVKVISYLSVLRKPYLFIKKFFPLIDLAIIITITFWLISWIFRDSDLLPIVIAIVSLILLSLLGWLWGRDFIAGIILKSENYFEKNKMVRVNNQGGRIIKTTFRYLELQTDDGATIRIPYSRIAGEFFSKLSTGDKYESHLITLHVKETTDTKRLREKLRSNIYNSPWYLTGKEPSVEIISADEGGYKINLNVYTLNSSHTDLIRRDLMAALTE